MPSGKKSPNLVTLETQTLCLLLAYEKDCQSPIKPDRTIGERRQKARSHLCVDQNANIVQNGLAFCADPCV